jgi:hypothetical protein
MSYHRIAAARWPNIPISSQGRWALASCDATGVVKSVYLLDTLENARRAALGVDRPRIVDLEKSATCPLPSKQRKDDAEDRKWLERKT